MTSRYSILRFASGPWTRIASPLAVAVVLSGSVGCDQQAPEQRPLPSAAKPESCKAQARTNDPANVQYLPRQVEGYCIDPTGSDRAYGEAAKAPLDGICDVFDGECEIYKRHDVRRVVEVRYIDGQGSSATIDVYLSKFASRDKAYAMFTKRVVGDGDPAHADAHRPMEGGGAAALGIGNGYLWRGLFLAELTLNDETASTKELKRRADRLLPQLAKQLGAKLPGATERPEAVAALPSDGRLPLGIRYITTDVLDIQGAGPGAIGYYRSGKLRWRLLSVGCRDADQAEDVLSTMRSAKGAAKEEDLGEGAVRLVSQNGPAAPQTEWLVARSGRMVLGIGDESLVLREGMTAEEHRSCTLSQDDKRKRLRQLLAELRAKEEKPDAG